MNGKGITTLREKYQLHRTLGSTTYWGTERTTGEPVVVKTFAMSVGQEIAWQEAARRLKRCQHRHLATVRDYFLEEGQGYLVYEYVPGQSLAQLLKFGLVLPQHQALRAICQVGAALCSLHSQGIQHLGINPAKLMLKKQSNDIVLIDVALAWQLSPVEVTVEAANYLPPEQGQTDRYTPGMDVYALAATLHTLLTGNPPPCTVTEDTWQLSPHLSPVVQAVLQQGLALNPNQRSPTIKAWLSPLLAKSKETAPSAAVVAAETPLAVSPAAQSLDQGKAEAEKEVSLLPTPTVTPPLDRASGDTSLAPPPSQPVRTNSTFSLSLFPQLQAFKISEKLQQLTTRRPTGGQVGIPTLKAKLPGWLASPPPGKLKPLTAKGLLPVMATTSAIAFSAGIGFGLAVRLNRPQEAGASILHQEQSFPPRDAWPVSQPGIKNAEMIEPETSKIRTIDSIPDS